MGIKNTLIYLLWRKENIFLFIIFKEKKMSKICPETKEIVLYTECLECEEKTCKKGGNN